MIKNTQIQDGMHIFGQLPQEEKRVDFYILFYDLKELILFNCSDVSNLIGLELSRYWNDRRDSAHVIIRITVVFYLDIDRICKQIIRVFYMRNNNI